MKFKKFNSIENSYQEEFINSIYDRGYADGDYIVQEKVHGANLSFITNGKAVVAAKRTGLIDDSENFYNSKIVQAKYEAKIKQLFQYLAGKNDIKTLTVFGELFGGGYPHKDVGINKDAQLVQRGIYYNPENDFYAFDILIDNTEYLDVDKANELFMKFGFIYAKTLFKGSLETCLQYPNTFKTTIPEKYGLPELDGNTCEGVIIRPTKSLFFNSGSRLLIKNKNEDWSENNNFIEKDILKKLLQEEELSDEVENLCEQAFKYISGNRLSNVLSKTGKVNPKRDFGKVLGLFNKDILSGFLKDHDTAYNALEKHERKAVNKFVNKHANQLVSEQLEKHMT